MLGMDKAFILSGAAFTWGGGILAPIPCEGVVSMLRADAHSWLF